MLGLTDRYLPLHPPPGWGRAGIGHDLGDGVYILDRRPHLVAFRSAFGGMPRFTSGRQMVRAVSWATDYRQAWLASSFAGIRTPARYWFRVVDGPLAPLRSGGTEVWPAHLLGTESNPAVFREEGFVLELEPGASTVLEVPVRRGRWSIEAEGTGVWVNPTRIRSAGSVRVTVSAGEGPAHLTGLRFRRARRRHRRRR